jgi:hypothetical protein
MSRLPQTGGDQGIWGNILNDFLSVELNPDGTLKKAGDIAAAASNDSVVHNTSNETIGGVKTFSSSPVVPTPIASTQAANKSYVDSTTSAGAGTYLFAAQTASIAVSAAISISSAITLGQCRLSCTGAPAGSNLVVILQASADGGSIWTDAQQLSVIDGTTAAQTANPAYAVSPNALLRVNCTSSGSGTAATGVLFQVDYT